MTRFQRRTGFHFGWKRSNSSSIRLFDRDAAAGGERLGSNFGAYDAHPKPATKEIVAFLAVLDFLTDSEPLLAIQPRGPNTKTALV
ncbi:MAG: hypothetical protein C3F11_21080 [Methylocystaceae bacterium]|nr:MAG: hypothetical protein C3F11_21080 [Methylocystaceae bacterium]